MKTARQLTQISHFRTIPTQPEEVESPSLKIVDPIHRNCLGEVCFCVELLARESLNNVAIHRNACDADRSSELSLWVGREWMRLQASDEGSGFAWRKACQSRFDTAAPSGRGL
jgi:hypothetical protein